MSRGFLNFLFFFERIFAETANRAFPAFGNIFPRGTGRYTVIGIADSGVVNITARTNKFFHVITSFLKFNNDNDYCYYNTTLFQFCQVFLEKFFIFYNIISHRVKEMQIGYCNFGRFMVKCKIIIYLYERKPRWPKLKLLKL